MAVVIHHYFDPAHVPGSVSVGVSLTQQHAAGECDINQILARYRATGLISHVSGKSPQYGDFTDIGDFAAIQQKIVVANNMFDQLNSTIRRRFHNDPREFIAFCQDPDNRDEAVRLGLISSVVPSPSDGAGEGVKPPDNAGDVVNKPAAPATPEAH